MGPIMFSTGWLRWILDGIAKSRTSALTGRLVMFSTPPLACSYDVLATYSVGIWSGKIKFIYLESNPSTVTGLSFSGTNTTSEMISSMTGDSTSTSEGPVLNSGDSEDSTGDAMAIAELSGVTSEYEWSSLV